MNIVVVGGGPAGLYVAALAKKARPDWRVRVFERNRPDDTFGWGVVFSDQTLGRLRQADRDSYDAIEASFAHWDDIDVFVRGRRIRSSGHGFCGIARRRLLAILQERAAALGVELAYQTEIADDAGFDDADLIVAADGINSRIRAKYADTFAPDVDLRPAPFVWLGTTRPFEAFTFIFKETAHGLFQAHAYQFDRDLSTFIVECDEASYRAAGIEEMSRDEAVAWCERTFAEWLDGHRLLSNAAHLRGSAWIRFPRIACKRWSHGKVVLMGDAAHTAHFSIGSGTKLALEDAIGLAEALTAEPDRDTALVRYQRDRMTEALRLQNAARNSMEWFENVKRYWHLEPEQFAYSLLTRSQRVSHENLRRRDAAYVEGVEGWFATAAPTTAEPSATVDAGRRSLPPMFAPLRLRGLGLANRIVVSPMAMYAAEAGKPGDFHLVHLGTRAQGGAGLIFTEMTCVSADARITPACAGMYDDAHETAWRRIVRFVHDHSQARICLQLGHAGRKGSTRRPWEGDGGDDQPLPPGDAWPTIAPSPLAWCARMPAPRAMSRADMDRVRDDHVSAVARGLRCGFDMIELHAAHGYLLSSFLSPLTNHRDDAYGGPLENRLRFPLEVFAAMRAAWPADRPMSVRLSATDWAEGGIDGPQAVAIARAFKQAGADLIDVSAGQVVADQKPVYGRLFQTPFSDRIRNEVGIATMAVGNIVDFDQANSIVAAGRADLVAMARPHLADPYWTQRAAVAQGVEMSWPVQYRAGWVQVVRERSRAAEQPGPDGV
jgi:anthraniloyl-CoA monooxygenase